MWPTLVSYELPIVAARIPAKTTCHKSDGLGHHNQHLTHYERSQSPRPPWRVESASAGLTAKYTTAVDAAVQLLGSHEYYYWGYG